MAASECQNYISPFFCIFTAFPRPLKPNSCIFLNSIKTKYSPNGESFLICFKTGYDHFESDFQIFVNGFFLSLSNKSIRDQCNSLKRK